MQGRGEGMGERGRGKGGEKAGGCVEREMKEKERGGVVDNAVERMFPFSVASALALGGEHCRIQSR